MSDKSEFSVYWWDPQGYSHKERSWITAQEAVDLAFSLTQRPATTILKVIRRIIITDGMDHTVFEWKIGEGVTFPPPLKEGTS